MFDYTKIEKKVPLQKLSFDGNEWEHLRFIRLENSAFICDTDVVQHSRYTDNYDWTKWRSFIWVYMTLD